MSGCCWVTISTSEVAVIQSCGKYEKLAEAGCTFYNCLWEGIAGVVSLRVEELSVHLETKTKDNVFVDMNVTVQYQAVKEKIYQAFYSLADHKEQMKSYVHDSVRASLCHLTLDQAFEAKDEISTHLKTHLQEVFHTYGYMILNALVTDLSPDQRVRDAMNEINASKRLKEAAYQRAEGEKIVKVKRAEAEAESMYLSGVGVANQRKAIMDGLKESIVEFTSSVSETSSKDVMDLLVLTQYFNTLSEVGGHPGTKCVFLPNDDQPIRSGIMQANAILR